MGWDVVVVVSTPLAKCLDKIKSLENNQIIIIFIQLYFICTIQEIWVWKINVQPFKKGKISKDSCKSDLYLWNLIHF